MLTTYPYHADIPLQAPSGEHAAHGTVWDYFTACTAQTWVATSQLEDIVEVHATMANVPINTWMGKHYVISNPKKMYHSWITNHEAFIDTHRDQVLTGVLPPLCIWTDQGKRTGAWAHIATTYIDYWETSGFSKETVHTGLVLTSTLGCSMQQ